MSKVMPRFTPARSATSKKVCSAGKVPAETVWSFSISSSMRVSASATFRPHSEPCEDARKSPIAIFSRLAPSVVAAAMPRCRARCRAGRLRPTGPRGCCRPRRGRRVRGSSATGSRSSSPRTSTESAPAARASCAHHSWPCRPTSAAPKDDSEINTGIEAINAPGATTGSGRGTAGSSRSVGLPKNSVGGACSTILPSAMKITRSATLRAKPISWVTHSMVMPSSARSSSWCRAPP